MITNVLLFVNGKKLILLSEEKYKKKTFILIDFANIKMKT